VIVSQRSLPQHFVENLKLFRGVVPVLMTHKTPCRLATGTPLRYDWSNIMSEEELRKKIELLERENARLNASKRPADYSVREDEYKGHPVLVFEGPTLIRPMTLGIGKLRAIQACSRNIENFLNKLPPGKAGGESLQI
jgi:hypothetical protein